MTLNISDYFADLQAHEYATTWLYCDRLGYVTIGIGCRVFNADAAAALPWATGKDDPRAAWLRVHNAFGPAKPSALYYQSFSDLRLTMDAVTAMVAQRLETEFMPCLYRLCPGFDDFPLPARRALVDMAWQYGDESSTRGLAGFPSMLAAFIDQLANVDGTNLEHKAEAAADAVKSMAAVDAQELTPTAATMLRVMRGEP